MWLQHQKTVLYLVHVIIILWCQIDAHFPLMQSLLSLKFLYMVTRIAGSPMALLVKWSPPAEKNGIIIAYTVYCYESLTSGSGYSESASGEGSGTTDTLTNVTVPGNNTNCCRRFDTIHGLYLQYQSQDLDWGRKPKWCKAGYNWWVCMVGYSAQIITSLHHFQFYHFYSSCWSSSCLNLVTATDSLWSSCFLHYNI